MLRRVDLVAHRVLEVFVGDFTVFVSIEFVKDQFELVIIEVNAPVVQIVLKLSRHNGSSLFLVQIYKRFLKGFPLEMDLVNNCFLNVHAQNGFLRYHSLLVPLEQIFLIRRVFD